MSAEVLVSGPPDAAATLMLAPGAGGAMDSVWMTEMAEVLAERGIRTIRFEFPYMAGRRTGRRTPAPKAERSVADYREAVAHVADRPLFIGGKSYGGRVASILAPELFAAGTIAGLVCLGYPFHPPGKPEQLRTAHLLDFAVPTLICQGTRDPFGSQPEVADYELSPAITVRWFDGSHELQPLKSAGVARPLSLVGDAVAEFVRALGHR